jgi:chromosome segregation ATPase
MEVAMGIPVRRLWPPVVAVVLLGVGAVMLGAQGAPPADASMRELVAEVRALRQAVERGTTLTARTQALLGRVQLQENRLGDLGGRLDEARQRVRAAATREITLSTGLAAVAARVEHVPAGSEERREYERELRAQREQVQAAQAQVAQLRAEEQELQSALSAEQSRWSDFNGRLEAIEQEFARGSRP